MSCRISMTTRCCRYPAGQVVASVAYDGVVSCDIHRKFWVSWYSVGGATQVKVRAQCFTRCCDVIKAPSCSPHLGVRLTRAPPQYKLQTKRDKFTMKAQESGSQNLVMSEKSDWTPDFFVSSDPWAPIHRLSVS